jgi:hypothetical protein
VKLSKDFTTLFERLRTTRWVWVLDSSGTFGGGLQHLEGAMVSSMANLLQSPQVGIQQMLRLLLPLLQIK